MIWLMSLRKEITEPQCGQKAALSLTVCPHSGQEINANLVTPFYSSYIHVSGKFHLRFPQVDILIVYSD